MGFYGINQSQGFSPLSFLGGYGLGSMTGLMGGMMGGSGGILGGMGGGMLPMMMGGMSMLPLFLMLMGGMFNQGQQAGLGAGYGGGYPGGYGGCIGGYGYGGGGYYPPIAQGPSCCCCDCQSGISGYGGGNQFPFQSPPQFPPQGSGELNNNTQNKTVSYTDSSGYKITTNYSSPEYPTVTVQGPNGKTLVTEDGDPHEQLGQGVQDLNNGAEGNWTQNNRQLILPDGTTVSMTANGASGAGAGIKSVNIVDPNGQQAVQETGLNSGNPDVQETNNPSLIAQDANSINYTNAAALGRGPNGQSTFEQLQSQSVPTAAGGAAKAAGAAAGGAAGGGAAGK